MRLIDADGLMDRLRGNVLIDVTPELEDTILHQPTAFETKKVIEELTKKQSEALRMRDDKETSCITELKLFWHSRLEAYTLALEIIEKGGIE